MIEIIWDDMGWDGMGLCATICHGMRWHRMGWDGIGHAETDCFCAVSTLSTMLSFVSCVFDSVK